MRVAYRKLFNLKLGFRDVRIFYKNRAKSFKKIRRSVRKNNRQQKLSEHDFKIIKEEVNNQKYMLRLAQTENKDLY